MPVTIRRRTAGTSKKGTDLRYGLGFLRVMLKTWLRCPRQYELKYVRGFEPEMVPRALAFGSAFHAALARHYVAKKELKTATSIDEPVHVASGIGLSGGTTRPMRP